MMLAVCRIHVCICQYSTSTKNIIIRQAGHCSAGGITGHNAAMISFTLWQIVWWQRLPCAISKSWNLAQNFKIAGHLHDSKSGDWDVNILLYLGQSVFCLTGLAMLMGDA
jgi:hypothetical protein